MNRQDITIKKSKGAALLIMLSIFIVAFTVAAIARLSLNRTQLERGDVTTKVLNQAREALLGYALRQPFPNKGRLPCPDRNNDGNQDIVAGTCPTFWGLLPYRTLDLPELRDGSNTLLWYIVAPQHAPPTNPSSALVPALNVDGVIFTAAIVIAPGVVVRNQARTTQNPYGQITQYLEPENSDLDNDYTARIIADPNNSMNDQNDRVMGIAANSFWVLMSEITP